MLQEFLNLSSSLHSLPLNTKVIQEIVPSPDRVTPLPADCHQRWSPCSLTTACLPSPTSLSPQHDTPDCLDPSSFIAFLSLQKAWFKSNTSSLLHSTQTRLLHVCLCPILFIYLFIYLFFPILFKLAMSISFSFDSVGMNLSKLQETVKDRGAWHAEAHGVAKSWT